MNDAGMIELETRIAYQDLTISELNEIVISLRVSIEKLTFRMAQMEEQLRSGGGMHIRSLDEETPPPHY